MGILVLVGAHLTAAMLGLYSPAPSVTVLHPLTGSSHNGRVEIAALADDGPNGSGVRAVEFQVDSTSGTWRPMVLDTRNPSTYRAQWDASRATQGEHAIYLRAIDYTGNLRTVDVRVQVDAADALPTRLPGSSASADRAVGPAQVLLSERAHGEVPVRH